MNTSRPFPDIPIQAESGQHVEEEKPPNNMTDRFVIGCVFVSGLLSTAIPQHLESSVHAPQNEHPPVCRFMVVMHSDSPGFHSPFAERCTNMSNI